MSAAASHPNGDSSGRCVNLGDALKAVVKQYGLATPARDVRFRRIWREVVGPELAAVTRVASFRKGALRVEVESSAVMNDLAFCRAALLKDIQSRVKRPYVARLVLETKADTAEHE